MLTLTYGALVQQIIKDYEDITQINIQLEKLGHNIGSRLIDEFLAKSNIQSTCQNFRETADVIAKVGFKMFLGASYVFYRCDFTLNISLIMNMLYV